jgi:hypothetical protein
VPVSGTRAAVGLPAPRCRRAPRDAAGAAGSRSRGPRSHAVRRRDRRARGGAAGSAPVARSQGERGVPKCGFTPRPEKANSVMLVRPSTTKPARCNLATEGDVACAGGASPARRTRRGRPARPPSYRSFTEIGKPAQGLGARPRREARHRAGAARADSHARRRRRARPPRRVGDARQASSAPARRGPAGRQRGRAVLADGGECHAGGLDGLCSGRECRGDRLPGQACPGSPSKEPTSARDRWRADFPGCGGPPRDRAGSRALQRGIMGGPSASSFRSSPLIATLSHDA